MRIKTRPLAFYRLIPILLLLIVFSAAAQDSPNTVIAKTGDGIFSVLRKSGMDPIKYYEKFLSLNHENIRNGSELIIGKEYVLPMAPDSYKAMGTKIVINENTEQPIFDESHLSLMAHKDSSLRNTVYYFAHSGDIHSKKRFEGVMGKLAKNLMERGARVYILDEGINESLGDSVDMKMKKSRYGDYSSAINRRYLKHRGSYQRVILLEDDHYGDQKNLALQVSHSKESREGIQLARSFNEILSKNLSKPSKNKKELNAFKDEASIYFSNNLVPPVIILSLVNGSDKMKNGFDLKSEKKPLATLLNDGILEDYSQLNLENQ